MAIKNLNNGVPANVVKSNYNDIRSKIIAEMKQQGKIVGDDYLALEK